MSSTTTTPSVSTTSSTPSATPTGSTKSGNSAPFLFFIALGLGVVFTNLWLIVGIKYCFRRRRRLAALNAMGYTNDEEYNATFLDPVVAGNLFGQRRLKRLITLEDLDDRFPEQKYKVWIAKRESEGLPSSGGIVGSTVELNGEKVATPVPGSGPASVHIPKARSTPCSAPVSRPGSAAGTRPVTRSNTPNSHLNRVPAMNIPIQTSQSHDFHTPILPVPDSSYEFINLPESTDSLESVNSSYSCQDKSNSTLPSEVRMERLESLENVSLQDLHNHDIKAAVVSEVSESSSTPIDDANVSGDMCAICLENLEPEDDVRALQCNHVFHSPCITPWLTTRHSFCPLCKMDFYRGPTRQQLEYLLQPNSIYRPPLFMPFGHQTPYLSLTFPSRAAFAGWRRPRNGDVESQTGQSGQNSQTGTEQSQPTSSPITTPPQTVL